MAERIMRWSVPLDEQVHLIGWGEPVFIDIVNAPATVMWVHTIEEVEGDEPVLPERPVQIFQTDQDLPEIYEVLGSATATSNPYGPRLAPKIYHLVAVEEGAGPSPSDGKHYSTSLTTPDGTLIASIVVDPIDDGAHDFAKVLNGGIEHMRFLLATGVQD